MRGEEEGVMVTKSPVGGMGGILHTQTQYSAVSQDTVTFISS